MNDGLALAAKAFWLNSQDDTLWLSMMAKGLREFQRGAELEDGGRRGMSKTLSGLFCLAWKHLPDTSGNFLQPLLELQQALDDLDHGITHPAFEPSRRPVKGRPIEKLIIRKLKVHALVASEILFQHNTRAGQRRKRREADQIVFRLIRIAAEGLGVRARNNQPLDVDCIKSWRHTLRKINRTGDGSHPLQTEFSLSLEWARYRIARGHQAEIVAGQLIAGLDTYHWPRPHGG